MRYITYFKNAAYRKSYKLRVNKLDKEDRKKHVLYDRLNALWFFFCLILSLSAVGGVMYLTSLLGKAWYFTTLGVILGIAVFILMSILAGLLFSKIEKAFSLAPLPSLTKEDACVCSEPIRKYFKIPEKYVVTKCYQCTNDIFNNKDVLLFFHKNKLRITNDLFSSIKTLGCYEFNLDEIRVENQCVDGKTVTVISSEKLTFRLSYRAKTFIDNYLTTKKQLSGKNS